MNPAPSAPNRTRFRWALVLTGLVAFVLLALSVRHATTTKAWERPILNTAEGVPFPLRSYVTGLFEPIPFAFATIALAFAAGARGRAHLMVPGLGGCLAAVIAAQLVLKPIVDRVRTFPVGPYHRLAPFGGPMFPSAHVTAAAAWAALAWMVVEKRSPLKPLILALPLIVGWAVMSTHMHNPADVAGGLILGPIVVYCTLSAVRVTTRWTNARTVGTDLDPEPLTAAY